MERATAWGQKPDFEKKFADLEAVTQIDPNHVVAWNRKAWLRATCPDAKHRNGQQAVEYATKACELTAGRSAREGLARPRVEYATKACELTAWKKPGYLDTLSAAYAEAGDFAKAVEWQQKGMDLAPADQKADYESRLKLYRDNKPFRQTAK